MADDPEEGEEGETSREDGAVELDAPDAGGEGRTAEEDGDSLGSSQTSRAGERELECIAVTGRDDRYHSGRGCSELYFSARLMRNSFKWIKGETEIARHRIYANVAGIDVIKIVN